MKHALMLGVRSVVETLYAVGTSSMAAYLPG
jgi:hypothetical protein